MNASCVICGENFSENVAKAISSTKCGHVYHELCIHKWLERSESCPNCRMTVDKNSIFKLHFSMDSDESSRNDAKERRNRSRDPTLQKKNKERGTRRPATNKWDEERDDEGLRCSGSVVRKRVEKTENKITRSPLGCYHPREEFKDDPCVRKHRSSQSQMRGNMYECQFPRVEEAINSIFEAVNSDIEHLVSAYQFSFASEDMDEWDF